MKRLVSTLSMIERKALMPDWNDAISEIKKTWDKSLNHQNTTTHIFIDKKGNICGYMLAYICNDQATLTNLATIKGIDNQKFGNITIGRHLMDTFFDLTREKHVRQANWTADGIHAGLFYKKYLQAANYTYGYQGQPAILSFQVKIHYPLNKNDES